MKNIMKSILAISLLLMFTMSMVGTAFAAKLETSDDFTVYGKAKIKGKVTENIKITLSQGDDVKYTSFSDEKGYYYINDVVMADYKLTAEFDGYEPVVKKIKSTKKATSKIVKNVNFKKAVPVEEPVADTVAPIVALDAHIEATNTSVLTFTGVVDDETAKVFVNGVEATLINNVWSIELDLPEGTNIITVTAVDLAGNEATPVVSEILIDTTAPDTFIDNVTVLGTDVDTEFHGTESVYSAKMDDGEWTAWQDGHFFTFTDLAYGEHTLYVRSMDDVGNLDLSPAVYTFTIEEPQATIAIMEDQMDFMILASQAATFTNIGYHTLSRTGDDEQKIVQLMKFDSASVPVDADIKSAKLVLTHFLYNAGGIATTDDWQYNIYDIVQEWDETLVGYPEVDNIEGVITGTIYDDVTVETDITQLVKNWVSGQQDNNGIYIEVDEKFGRNGEGIVNNVLIGREGNNPQAPNPELAPKIIVEYY